MRRLKLFIFFSLIKIITLNAEQIYVAPILFVDENEERYEADENFQDDLTYELNEKKEFLGIEVIKTRSHIKNIRSSYDALKLCKEEKISYLIYGWVKKTEYTYECEIRIFDGEGRKNIFTVYAKDGKENYEKFIENISEKILKKYGINTSLFIDFSGNMYGDKKKIYQMFIQILRNSINAILTRNKLDKKINIVVVGDKNHRIILEIIDNGVGMTQEEVKAVMRPYSDAKGDSIMGTGLITIYKIVKEHNGFMTISSELDVGTKIRIIFNEYREETNQ